MFLAENPDFKKNQTMQPGDDLQMRNMVAA